MKGAADFVTTVQPLTLWPMKRWYGKLLGFIAGVLLMRTNPLLGAMLGLLIGHAFDADWFRSPRENPYRVLGLTEEANDAEVDLAYRRLISQYHPDRMNGVAEELRKQAEVKAREINAAYDRIKTLRRK
jgi:DnaJ-domain-containing protein 1